MIQSSEWLNDQREKLSKTLIDAPQHYRILAVGRKVNGSTDIVACLERALRNLGHHVVLLDLKKHPKIITDPNKAQGGNGPIYLNLDDIRGAIIRFRPQILLCLAGGLAFREEDAAWLRSQGIVTLGITLSDPDVFETVHTFADVFDFHTTNALSSIEMYKKAGVTRTLHFPFGVDRAFVTQNVQVPKEYIADVICLGHGTAHPLRDPTMMDVYDRLKADFRVMTYGRGWSIPDSRPVEGLEVLQASRGGLLHVNFPMTRAGFTNVKCGVFETVASGGILVTKRFDEMGLFFDFDHEIGGYKDFAELPEVLESLLSRPESLEEMRRAAFARLVNEHLYEHRFLKLFENMREAVTGGGAVLIDPSRAGEIAEILSEDHNRVRIISLSGFYGARNLGDDMIMEAIAEATERNVPGAQVMIVAQSPTVVELTAGRQSVARNNHHAVDTLISKSDAFILGGGGLWHDYTFEQAGGIRGIATGATISIAGVGVGGMLAHIRGIPFHVVGLGVGPLSNVEAGQLVKFVAGMSDSITVRDEDSRDLLVWAGVERDRVSVAPDVVHSRQLKGEPLPEFVKMAETHTILSLNLRPWTRADVTIENVLEEVVEAIHMFAANCTRPVAVALLPMQEGSTYDRAVLGMVAEKLGETYPILTLPEPLCEADFIGALKVTDLLLSMRLHSCLLAHRLGKPTVALAYDPKLNAHFAEMGRPVLAAPLNIKAAPLARLLKAALTDYSSEDLARTTARVASDSMAALERVVGQIADQPRRDTIWTIDPEPTHAELRASYSDSSKRRGMEPIEEIAELARRIREMGKRLAAHVTKYENFEDYRISDLIKLPRAMILEEKIRQAELLMETGQLSAAREILNEVRLMDTDQIDAIRYLMQIYLIEENWTKLTFYISKASGHEDLKEKAIDAQFSMYMKRGKIDRAHKLVHSLPTPSGLRSRLETMLAGS